MYDLSQWPYADEAVECLRDAHRFLMHREQSRSIMDSTHEVYRSGGQVDWKSVLDDLGIASGKLGITPPIWSSSCIFLTKPSAGTGPMDCRTTSSTTRSTT